MHLLRCPHCYIENTSRAKKRTRHSCQQCGKDFLDLGPLPFPDWSIETASELNLHASVTIPPAASVSELPEWCCPWCGGNVGPQKECSRCHCNLSICAPLFLPVMAKGLCKEDIGALLYQAIAPMTGAVALSRLYRLTEQQALKIGATRRFANRMKGGKYPPRVKFDKKTSTTQTNLGQLILASAIVCFCIAVLCRLFID